MRMGTLERIHGGFQEKRSSSRGCHRAVESRAEKSGELGGDGAVNFQASGVSAAICVSISIFIV